MFNSNFAHPRLMVLALTLAVLTFILLPVAATGQTVTGTLQGTVTDSKGAVAPDSLSYDFTARPSELNPRGDYLDRVKKSAIESHVNGVSLPNP